MMRRSRQPQTESEDRFDRVLDNEEIEPQHTCKRFTEDFPCQCQAFGVQELRYSRDSE